MSEKIAKPIINESLIKHKKIVYELLLLLEKCSQNTNDSNDMILFWSEYAKYFGQDLLFKKYTGIRPYSGIEPYQYQQSILDQFDEKVKKVEEQLRHNIFDGKDQQNITTRPSSDSSLLLNRYRNYFDQI